MPLDYYISINAINGSNRSILLIALMEVIVVFINAINGSNRSINGINGSNRSILLRKHA
jgi:hypothetical protein